MILESVVKKSGGSKMILIPHNFVEYYKLDYGTECKIEDVNRKEIRITFE